LLRAFRFWFVPYMDLQFARSARFAFLLPSPRRTTGGLNEVPLRFSGLFALRSPCNKLGPCEWKSVAGIPFRLFGFGSPRG